MMGRHEFETNVFGPLATSRAFAPVLAANGGGAIINVLSVLSWVSFPRTAIYCASKAAGWSLTNSLRQDLRDQKTQVLALHVGLMDTDMAAGLDAPQVFADRRRRDGPRWGRDRRVRGACRQRQPPRPCRAVPGAHRHVPGTRLTHPAPT